MSNKNDYVTTMESQIKAWDVEVDKLNAESTLMSAENRAIYNEQLEVMRSCRAVTLKNMEEMRAASETAWEQMQAGADAAWKSMKGALEKVSPRV